MPKTDRKRAIRKVAEALPVITPKDVRSLGYTARDLWELAKAGHLQHVGRGRYRHPRAKTDTYQDLIEVAAQAPESVFCLLTALFIHGIGTQMPPAIWIARRTRSRTPKISGLEIITVMMSSKVLSYGVMTKRLGGFSVRVTDPAKTVADCFRHRSKVGTDVAIEALRDGLRKRAFTSDELYEAAQVCRVWNVIRPYAEAIA